MLLTKSWVEEGVMKDHLFGWMRMLLIARYVEMIGKDEGF